LLTKVKVSRSQKFSYILRIIFNKKLDIALALTRTWKGKGGIWFRPEKEAPVYMFMIMYFVHILVHVCIHLHVRLPARLLARLPVFPSISALISMAKAESTSVFTFTSTSMAGENTEGMSTAGITSSSRRADAEDTAVPVEGSWAAPQPGYRKM
jgi:hypothetical protein